MKYKVGQLIAKVSETENPDVGYISKIQLVDDLYRYQVEWISDNPNLNKIWPSSYSLLEYHIDAFRGYFEIFFRDIMGANNENQA